MDDEGLWKPQLRESSTFTQVEGVGYLYGGI